MNTNTSKIRMINESIQEAKRFIRCATEWRKVLRDDPSMIFGSKEGGSAKRASMDLTRVLAKLRK